jgi:hypothetical protein
MTIGVIFLTTICPLRILFIYNSRLQNRLFGMAVAELRVKYRLRELAMLREKRR